MPKTRRAMTAFAVGVGLSLGAIPLAQAKNSPAKEACKNGGYKNLGNFRNQGQCVKAANHADPEPVVTLNQ